MSCHENQSPWGGQPTCGTPTWSQVVSQLWAWLGNIWNELVRLNGIFDETTPANVRIVDNSQGGGALFVRNGQPRVNGTYQTVEGISPVPLVIPANTYRRVTFVVDPLNTAPVELRVADGVEVMFPTTPPIVLDFPDHVNTPEIRAQSTDAGGRIIAVVQNWPVS